jgi:serine/threonine kinase 3
MMNFRSLKKLSEESLTRQPEEVFDIICKLGEGSYGSVYKALHKESDQVSHTQRHVLYVLYAVYCYLF